MSKASAQEFEQVEESAAKAVEPAETGPTGTGPAETGPVEADADTDRLTIGQVVAELRDEFEELTESKVRFLEERGLIHPDRSVLGYRLYNMLHVAVLRWILNCQKNQYLPLKVITERIERGEHLAEIFEQETGRGARERRAANSEQESLPTTDAVRAANPLSESDGITRSDAENAGGNASKASYSTAELCVSSGLTADEIAELADYGILPHSHLQADGEANESLFSETALEIACIARAFMAHGLEPRHMRIMVNSAQRDAGMLLQGLQPFIFDRSPVAQLNASEAAENLLGQCERLREIFVRVAMTEVLGP